jgi:hypothetical protein
MKYSKIIVSCSVMLALATSSCKKLIEIKETELIAGDVALKTVSNCESAVLGAYGAFGVEMGIQWNAIFSDELVKGEFYNSQTTHEWQYGAGDVGIRDNYRAVYPYYTVIDRANRVLKVVGTADSTVVGDNAKRLRLRGEALFLRAIAHFELYRFYCANYTPTGLAMPYMEKGEEIGYTSRIDMGAYFTKLKNDITEARTLLPNNLSDINRANVLAAAALQARIALAMGDWTAAETYSTDYINGLPLSPIGAFGGIWTDGNTNEVAFRLVRTITAGGKIGAIFRGASTSATKLGTITWQPSSKLWNSYDPINDVRFAAYLKDEPLLTADGGRPSKIVKKYAGGAYFSNTENLANAKVFRTGEMYLIRAEARAEQNKFTGANSAETDVNALRTARIASYVPVTFASKVAAIDAIMLERFKELPYEGHRFYDLKRRGLPVSRLAADAPSAAGTTLPANDFRFLLPIPQSEILANPTMQQNPGYQ